jgi:hypothetical protein
LWPTCSMQLVRNSHFAVLHEDIADAFEQVGEQRTEDSGPKKNVINDKTASEVSSEGGTTRTKKGLPFAVKHAHHAGAESRGIPRTKGITHQQCLLLSGAKKASFSQSYSQTRI